MEIKVSKWTTARGAEVELHTQLVTERPWFKDDFGTEHTKKDDAIEIVQVIINGQSFTRSHLYKRDTHEGARVINLGTDVVNGKRVTRMVPLPAEVEASVWGEWDARQTVQREAQAKADQSAQEELQRKIARGYCTKCHSYCYGDCDAN